MDTRSDIRGAFEVLGRQNKAGNDITKSINFTGMHIGSKNDTLNLINLNLTRAFFLNSFISYTIFFRANFDGTFFHLTDFYNVEFFNSSFNKSYFSDATFNHVSFTNVNLRTAVGLTQTQIDSCRFKGDVILPDGLHLPQTKEPKT